MSEKTETRLRRTIRRYLVDIISRMSFIDRFKFLYFGKLNWNKYYRDLEK